MMTTADLRKLRAKKGCAAEKEVLIDNHAFTQRALSQAVIMEHVENIELFRSKLSVYENRIIEITF